MRGAAPETLPAINPPRPPEELAFERGHTERASFSSAEHDLDLAYSAAADLDDRFDATCMETGDRLQVSGWLFQREDAA